MGVMAASWPEVVARPAERGSESRTINKISIRRAKDVEVGIGYNDAVVKVNAPSSTKGETNSHEPPLLR